VLLARYYSGQTMQGPFFAVPAGRMIFGQTLSDSRAETFAVGIRELFWLYDGHAQPHALESGISWEAISV
jgi:hypothetical protein